VKPSEQIRSATRSTASASSLYYVSNINAGFGTCGRSHSNESCVIEVKAIGAGQPVAKSISNFRAILFIDTEVNIHDDLLLFYRFVIGT